MADYNLGTARGQIQVDYDGRGVAEAKRDFQGLDRNTQQTRRGLGQVGVAAGASGLAIAAGLGFAAKVALDFEKQISAIGAVSGASGQELEVLRKKALDLGSSTAFSASEAALAMEELAKAGVPLDGILNGAADAAVALAAAGGIELPAAAELAADAMNSFRLRAQDMPRVADLIAGAANSSSISVGDFGQSLKQVGAVANLVGASFEDTATAIALMGKMGIKGSDAGTSLKTMLLNLNPQTEKQRDLMRELGIVTADGANKFFDATGKMRPMAEIAGVLQGALKGMTKQQQLATLEILFGSDAIRAAAVLAGEGAAGFDEMSAAMGRTSAADVAAARLNNTAGALEQMKGALETAAINLGTIFLPAIKAVAEFIARLSNAFSNLDPRWQKLIGFALAGAAALATAMAAIAGIGFAIIGVGAAFAALKIVAIVGAIIAAIGLLAAGFVVLWNRSAAFRNMIMTIFAALMTHARNMIAAWTPFVNFVRTQLIPMLANGFKAALDKLQPAFLAVSNFITTRVNPALTQLRAALVTAMPTIISIARFVGTVLVTGFKALAAIIGFVAPIILRIAGPIFSALITAIATAVRLIRPMGQAFMAVFNVIRGGVLALLAVWRGVWSVFGPLVRAAFNLIRTVVSTGIAAIRAVVTAGMAVVRAAFQIAMRAIQVVVRSVMNVINALFGDRIRAMRASASSGFAAIRSVISGAMNAIRAVVSAVWNAVVGIVRGAVARVVATMNGISAMVSRVRSFFNQLRAAASGGTNSLIAFVRGIPGRVVGAIGNLGSLLFSRGAQLIQGFVNGIRSRIGAAADAVRSAVSAVTRFLPGSPAKEGPLSGKGYVLYRGQHFAEDFSRGIRERAGVVAAAAHKMVEQMASAIPMDNATRVAAGVSGAFLPPSPVRPVASTTGGGTTQVFNTTVHAPQNMNPNEIAQATSRRLSLALSAGITSTPS